MVRQWLKQMCSYTVRDLRKIRDIKQLGDTIAVMVPAEGAGPAFPSPQTPRLPRSVSAKRGDKDGAARSSAP